METLGKIILAVCATVVSAVILEGLLALNHYTRTGALFYNREPVGPAAPAPEAGTSEVMFPLHPYFGYVVRPGTKMAKWSANASGFWDDNPRFPVAPKPNQAIVAIFGGSVAAAIGMKETDFKAIRGAVAALPNYSGKEIVFLNFAISGQKQPQQLLVFAYYLSIGQQFDMVVSIDGFNEVYIANFLQRRGITPDFPTRYHQVSEFLQGVAEKADSIEAVYLDWRSSEVFRRMEKCRLAICFYSYDVYARRLDRARSALRNSAAENPQDGGFIHVDRTPVGAAVDAPEGEVFDDVFWTHAADVWYQASAAMATLARAQEIDYIQFLQPTFYYQAQAVYDATATQEYAVPVRYGYPKLLARLETLRQRGVNAVSLLDVFGGVGDMTRPMYADTCCHPNDAGYRIIMNRMAEEITATFSPR